MIERKHIEEFKLLAMQYKDWRIPKARMLATLNALADSALAAIDESPWRSMESAPGVGVVVLLWAPSHARRPIEGFLSTSGIWWNMRGHEVQFPTHWMPLPAAPDGEENA